ncbi:ComEA family DNA-binding protein [Virgibacillus halodenitrificans]|uniref:ComEA family DNA-binding protein n=1 Tax=Virgibacillus halodenitrificans TaxID=1482 RepID=UPI001FB34B0C|nr:ComEA family DNA-binding protein [Virgibacillus halodenitrificans]MCJ0930801.1 ComEA family DNA-binding protein [Virgibacillus halodenitrificans]
MPIRNAGFLLIITSVVVVFLIITREEEPRVQQEISPLKISTTESQEKSNPSKENTKIMVDIKGAVAKPGVFEMPVESRVNDAIKLAGGFTADADQSQVNLAQKVQDEMIINIPVIGEEPFTQGEVSSIQTEKLSINYATQEEIETLNGIGPAKAQAIIQFREEHGFFSTAEDLLQVPGIGEKTLNNFIDDIQVP